VPAAWCKVSLQHGVAFGAIDHGAMWQCIGVPAKSALATVKILRCTSSSSCCGPSACCPPTSLPSPLHHRYALDHIPRNQAANIYARFVSFEKQHGSREGIEDVVASKRRFQYEEQLAADPLQYDTWFDYIRLEETAGDEDRIREVGAWGGPGGAGGHGLTLRWWVVGGFGAPGVCGHACV
jgi:hypothetical protein